MGICHSTRALNPLYGQRRTRKHEPAWTIKLDEWTAKDSRDTGRSQASARIADCIRRGRPSLELRDCDLSDLPRVCWTALAHLSSLSLDGVAGLSENVGELKNLQTLAITRSSLATLPDAIGQLTKLEHLMLSGNALIRLPVSIGDLCALKTLCANHNQLDSLPESIGRLAALTSLELRHNLLPRLPDGLGELHALEILYLDHNRLGALPHTMAGLRNLVRLDANDNLLENLPQEIGELAKLQCLTVYGNLLGTLPDSIRNLSALQYLFARDNRLTDVPEGLWDLPELRVVSLANNLLATLSDGIARLRGGTEVRAQGNPIPRDRITMLWAALRNSGIVFLSDFAPPTMLNLPIERATPRTASRNFGGQNPSEMEKMLDAFQTGLEENCYHAAFFTLLTKLVDTRDYQLDRDGMSLRVQKVVNALHDDHRLRADCFAVAESATSSCADSAEAMLQALEAVMLCNDITNGKYSRQQAYDLGVSHFRLDVLKEIAARKVKSMVAADAVEVHLAYVTGLRAELGLPTHAADMLFRNLSGVTADDLANAGAEVRQRESANGGDEVVAYLCDWAPWIALIRKDNETAFAAIEQDFDMKMEALYEEGDKLPSDVYLKSVNDLARERSAAIGSLVGKLTASYAGNIARAESGLISFV